MTTSRPLRVAVAQVESVLGDVGSNIAKHLEMIAQARSERVDVLLFPEMSLTGHSAGAQALQVALHREDPAIRTLAEASGPMTTAIGLIEETVAAQFHNSTLVVHDGAVAFIHRKINLATYGKLDDHKHFAAGRFVETFPIRDAWRSSVLICNDLWNPGLVHLAATHGATLLLAPISSALEAVGAEFDNPGGWDLCVRFFSMVYGLPILMANRVGQEGDLSFWGGSGIFDAFGKPLARLDDQEGLAIADLDYARVRQARYALPTVRDSNLDLIKREVDRLAEVIGVPSSIRRD